jgi:glycosyltransferase involved in cell wall biosynthesis
MTAISVVMGVYDGEATLPATLDGILAQTERDFELIAVDDGSRDGTPGILARYAGHDPRVRVIRRANAGLTRALIAGCAAARGVYIARHDAGDLSHPRRFELQKAALDADAGLSFVSCATQYAGPDLEPLYVVRGTGVAATPAYVLDPTATHGMSDGPTSHASAMFRRDAYEQAGGYRPQFYYGQDWDLWYRLAEIGKFQALSEILYTLRVTPDSISMGARRQQEAISALSLQALAARQRGESDAPTLAAAEKIGRVQSRGLCRRSRGLYFIGEALRRNGDARAAKYLFQSAVRCPLLLRAWLRWLQAIAAR